MKKKFNLSVTNMMIAINLTVFAVSTLTIGIGPAAYIFGINSPVTDPYITYITSAFTHGSLMHVAFNMYFLFFIGRMLEQFLKPPMFAVYYLLVAIASGFLTSMFSDALAVGASSVIYAILTTCIALDKSDVVGFNTYNSSILLRILLINIALTFIIPGISIIGHISGIVVGLIAALIIMSVKERGEYYE